MWFGKGTDRQWQQFITPTTAEWSTGNRGAAGSGRVVTPMPGRVVRVDVRDEESVTTGQRLLVVEAMKMEHAVKAPCDGIVEGLAVAVGGQVQDGDVLLTIKPHHV